MAPALRLFGVSIQAYPFAVLLAASAGLWVSARAAKKLSLDSNRIYDLGFYALLATAMGARVTYVIAHWSAYRQTPASALSLTTTALSWPGGTVVGLAVALFYGWRHRLALGVTLDALAPGAALALAIERLGAFLGGQSLGMLTDLPWGVYLWEQTRHPVQLYEMGTLLAILGWLWFRQGQRPFDGQRFVLFVILYAGSRVFLEAFRAQTPLLDSGMRIVQIAGLVVLLSATGYLYYRRFSGTAPPTDSTA